MTNGFAEIPPERISGNLFSRIGEDWMLVSAAGPHGVPNTMTASWGCAGVLWNRPVAVVFLRPQRYTTELVEAGGTLSLSFFEEGSGTKPADDPVRTALRFCGSHSGRDGDKFAATGLTAAFDGGIPYVAEADTALLCRVLYRSRLEEAEFLDRTLLSNYRAGDFHYVYVCEIRKVLKKQS